MREPISYKGRLIGSFFTYLSNRVRNPFRSDNHREGLEFVKYHPCKHLWISPKRGLL